MSSVTFERKDRYFDLHVPFFNNYLAEGFINHNSGKTYAGCLRGLLLSQYPGNFGLVGRSTYPELRDTTRRTFFELCPVEYYDEGHGGQWRPSENHLKFINGSEIIFRHLDTISEKELLSLNLGWFFIDQAEEIGHRVFQILQSRLRLNVVPNRYGFIVCNPEPNNWIDQMFRKPIVEGKENSDYFFLESRTQDNPYLPPDYVRTLLESYPEDMQKRYIEGRWDVFENQIYPEFDTRRHVITPFAIPKEWERLVGVDYGMVNPTCALWAAIDYDSNIFIFDEYYSPGVVSDHAKAILDKTGNQEISYWLIDPSTTSKRLEKDGKPWSVMEEFEDCGLYFTPANNEQLAGINRVKEFLKMSNNRRNPITKETPAPRLYIFKNCVNLVSEFPQYQWRKMRSLGQRNVKEQPRDFADHAMDACFSANTMIQTDKGEKAIQNVQVGDRVLTRQGYKKVTASAMTNKNARVYKILFSNGRTLTGTANHPIWIEGKGFVSLQDIRYGDMIRSCKNIQIGTDILPEERGKRFMEKFPRDVIFTMGTEIRKIMPSKIWNVLRRLFIKGFIGRKDQFFKKIAEDVIKIFRQNNHGKNFARITAKPAIGMRWGKTTWRGFALNVVKNLSSIDITERGIVQNIVMRGNILVKKSKQTVSSAKLNLLQKTKEQFGVPINVVSVTAANKEPVYNLSVADEEEYFANGILVHNCRYIIMSRFPAPLKRPTGQEIMTPMERKQGESMTNAFPQNYQGDEELGQFYADF